MPRKILKASFLTILLLASVYPGQCYVDLMAQAKSLQEKIKILSIVIETVHRTYVEEKDPDDLIDDAVKGMLTNLDPHTSYLSADGFDKWNQNFEGYAGIGITFEMIRDRATILKVMANSPAARAGLKPGDKIIAVDGQSIIGFAREQVSRILMGFPGTPVQITAERDGWSKARRILLVRDRIVRESVVDVNMLETHAGYLKIERFSGTTGAELDRALKELDALGMRQLILDLRGNSGGYLTSAVEVANKFLPAGRLIVYTRGRASNSFHEYHATNSPAYTQWPIVVLIDHGTASAAEIVAGALQDWDRALIVGKTSFGKGLVQSQYRFQNGSALLITTAHYYTPSGRLIQRDYSDMSKDEYYFEAYNDSTRYPPEMNAGRPKHLTAGGRVVYGGGGITPDVWLEEGNHLLSDSVRRLYFIHEQRLFYTFAEDCIHRHPGLRRLTLEQFVNEFQINPSEFEAFKKLVRQEEPSFPEKDFDQNATELKFLLQRDLAYFLWGDEGRFRVNLQRDEQLQQAQALFPQANALLTLNKIDTRADLERRD